jgi:beta-fructofuranosidase
MFRLPGHHLGDTWFHTTADRVHLFHLVCPNTVARHTRWSIAHATSTDLVHWTPHGALFDSRPDDPLWSCLSTGSVARYGDRYLMAFVPNHNQPEPRVAFAESPDLARWHVLPGPGLPIDDERYTRRGSRPFKNPRWRDPFLFEHEGALHLLITAADASPPDDRDGVVGHLRTRDLATWEYLPPLRTPLLGTDLECPKLHRIDGRWHLLVSLFNVLQSPEFAARQPPGLNSSTTFSLVADALEGPYELHDSGRILITDTPGCPYANNAVEWQGRWHLLGTCWSDRLGDRICDPVPLIATPQGLRQG